MIVYKYGALKPKVIGGAFEDLLEYQRESNRFYNALIEIERWRIAARYVNEALESRLYEAANAELQALVAGLRRTQVLSEPAALRLLDEWAAHLLEQHKSRAEAQRDTERLAYNAACRAAGQATTIGWGQKQAVTEMVAAAMKTRRSDEAKAHAKATRKEWPWIKRVMACCRPRHRRYDGEGLLAATVQGASKLLVKAVVAPESTAPVSIGQRIGGKKHSHEMALLRMRLRDGLSLEVPIMYSRDRETFRNGDARALPTTSIRDGVTYDVRVVFARLMIDRIGDRWVYSVHFTLDVDSPNRVGLNGCVGKCAVNFGWRRVKEGVRVAYAVDDLGNETSLVMPQELLKRQAHAESLRSLADDFAVAYLGDARGRTKARRRALSDPTATRRELGRIRLSFEQAAEQDPADLEHWARRDRHLYQWERDEVARTLRARRELYRLWARKLAAQYDAVVIEAFDMRSVVVRAPPGEREDEIPAARHYRFLVGPHYLRAEIKSVFREACQVLAPAPRSVTCHRCGKACKWDKARELRHDCEHCGASWDQDENDCRNLLADSEKAAE